jgi:hypothetical protein
MDHGPIEICHSSVEGGFITWPQQESEAIDEDKQHANRIFHS